MINSNVGNVFVFVLFGSMTFSASIVHIREPTITKRKVTGVQT